MGIPALNEVFEPIDKFINEAYRIKIGKYDCNLPWQLEDGIKHGAKAHYKACKSLGMEEDEILDQVKKAIESAIENEIEG